MLRSQLLALPAAAVLALAAACGPATSSPAGTESPAPATATSDPAPPVQSPAPPEPTVPGQPATVTHVVDGDTVDVQTSSGQALTIRVLGIDTPEVYGGAECWGPEASAFAEQTLAGRTVGLVADDTQDDTDRYGRSLRYLVLPDGGNYSVLAADAGAARSYVYGGNLVSEHEAIVAAEQRAQDADRGLWGPPCNGQEQTPEPAPEPEPEEPAGSCESGYDPCVPPYPPDVDCGDVDGPVAVTGSDPHGLDGDGDGRACE